jgi:hypothetical protein
MRYASVGRAMKQTGRGPPAEHWTDYMPRAAAFG